MHEGAGRTRRWTLQAGAPLQTSSHPYAEGRCCLAPMSSHGRRNGCDDIHCNVSSRLVRAAMREVSPAVWLG